MTGFARSHGVSGSYAWAWELKSVNSKGLDVKLRLPPGWDAIEAPARAKASEALSRGSVFANLTVNRQNAAPAVRVNEPVLAAVLATLKGLSGKVDAAPPTLDGILSLKGVIEVSDAEESEEERAAAEAAIVAGFAQTLKGLAEMRRTEGYGARQDSHRPAIEIAGAHRARRSDAGQEARGDQGAACREDRRTARWLAAFRSRPAAPGGACCSPPRPTSARSSTGSWRMSRRRKKLISGGGPIGRKLDFLAQELNREIQHAVLEGQ